VKKTRTHPRGQPLESSNPFFGDSMSDLKTRFETASQQAQQLPQRPDNMTLLKLYSLFKQATDGDVSGKRPGLTNLVGRAKYDAWAGLTGMSGEQAMQDYVDLVEKLKAGA
jgi:diazepam-binding inhibitor (GABA receptor modulator, acyl-CoA-binding protein)